MSEIVKAPNRQTEAMIRVSVPSSDLSNWWTVRTWFTTDTLRVATKEERRLIELAAKEAAKGDTDMNTVAEAVGKLEHVSAVEVVDYQGNGIVLYTDWS